jgi:hypothetical protein
MATERGSLGFGQRLVLLGAWLVSCGFVYVLGVYVGKGMYDRGPIHPGVSLPVDAAVPPAPPADAQAPLTFYDVLGTQQGAPAAARPTPPDAPAAARPTQPSTMNEQKLAAAPATPPAPPTAALPAAKPSPAAATPPARPAPVAPAVAPTDGAIPPLAAVTPPVAAKPAPPPSVAPAPAPAVPNPPAVPSPAGSPVRVAPPTPTAPAPAAAGLPPQVASGRWTVYANPSRDQLAVEYERGALRAKGYPAEVVTMKRDGDTWYRIRVGRYATEAQAQEASRKLRSDGVGHAFVQSE